MENKVYNFEEITEGAFPNETEPLAPSESQSGDIYSSTVVKDKKLPKKRIAVELLSTALNTRSRKILEEFELQQSGGFQIGNFQEGISGDTRITPNGIVMRNKSGIETLAQDGDTGDAIFAGQVRAGSTIVSNTIITEESSNGNGRTIYLNDGVPAIVIGDID